MKPERQRTAIAEACGWTGIAPYHNNGPLWGKSPDGTLHALPDYLNDLNAMHEAETEKVLGDRRLLYLGALEELLGVEEEPLSAIAEWTVVHATAAQKAEAFLKAMGTWEDEE